MDAGGVASSTTATRPPSSAAVVQRQHLVPDRLDQELALELAQLVRHLGSEVVRRFNGEIDWVQIDVGGEDADHMISPEERLRVAMARQ